MATTRKDIERLHLELTEVVQTIASFDIKPLLKSGELTEKKPGWYALRDAKVFEKIKGVVESVNVSRKRGGEEQILVKISARALKTAKRLAADLEKLGK